MKLICLAPHVYQDRRFEPGVVYDFDDPELGLNDEVATGFLRDFGPVNSDAVRRGNDARFAPAPAPVETEDEPASEPGEPGPDPAPMTVAELREVATTLGIELPKRATRAQLIELINAAPRQEPAEEPE